MKTKKLFLCMLLVLLSTMTVRADKYYKMNMKSRVKGELQFSTGKKYMIFNTAYEGTEPCYGFLYNMGTTFGVHRSTSVDQLIYNGAFVFELENAGDDDPHTFYLKSVPGGGYMDINGHQSIAPVKLKIYTWKEAQGKADSDSKNDDVYTVATNGVTLKDNNDLKQACVKSMNGNYSVISEHLVTTEENHVYLITNEDGTAYFSGSSKNGYKSGSTGHPFAFYECYELTSVGSFDIQDLHIYSRADMFSAQKMYGYINGADQISHNGETLEGSLGYLIDGDFKTSATTQGDAAVHYYQVNLGTQAQRLRFYMARRMDGEYAPINYELWATNDPDGTWTQITFDGGVKTLNSSLDKRLAYISGLIDLGSEYQHIRLQAPGEGNRTSSENYLALSELYVIPDRGDINSAIAYFDNTLPVAGTEDVYKQKIEDYNSNPSAVGAQLFSGVPVPGNKYRIYADAYSDGAYVNRHVSIQENADGVKKLTANGDYYSAAGAAQDAFEWYCEEAPDGKLLFRNVKYPELYLTNIEENLVTSDVNNAKWTINTNLTHHHGVPLLNTNMQYLAVFNHGDYWQGDVKRAMDQTVTSGLMDYLNTPDNVADDKEFIGGLCTDFVFIPVDLDENEARVIVTADDLVKRNSLFKVGGTVYNLPFSRVYKKTEIPTITIDPTAGDFHKFDGFYKGNEEIGETITAADYAEGGKLAGDDKIEARFLVNEEKLPQISRGQDRILYRIKTRGGKSLTQNAPMHRASLGYEDGEGDDDGVSMEQNKVHYYASFVSKNESLALLKDNLAAESFFYFTNTEAVSTDDYQAYINSAVTTFLNKTASEWTAGGSIYHIQPNAVTGGYGFAITRTQLDEANNPEGWSAEYTDNANIVTERNVEDANSAWEFERVDDEEAKEELTIYIKGEAAKMIGNLLGEEGKDGLDDTKIDNTIQSIVDIAGGYSIDGDGNITVDGTGKIANADTDVADLVGYAQQLHMLHHQIEYAMQALPQATDEEAESFQPKWYYVKNVNTQHYAHYKSADELMDLTQNVTDADGVLSHLFYFSGDVVNQGTKDEYLQAHIHNFMAMDQKDAEKDKTIVSYNRELFFNGGIKPEGDGRQTEFYLTESEQLKSGEAWQLTLDYNLANGAFFNSWGSGLLASGGNGTATEDGGNYNDGFQVYLKNNGQVVIRGGNFPPKGQQWNAAYGSGGNDVYVFSHTVGKYSRLKVVLTYANKRLQVAVTNSEGVTQTIKESQKGLSTGLDYIPCDNMQTVKKMASAIAGSSSFDMKADVVLAMKWDTHANNIANNGQGDTWYILPSSNTLYPGLAIVTESADDTNMGWSNVNGENKEIFTGPGVDDFSTWQFEKVVDFGKYYQDLLALYDIKDCVIYNKELAALFKLIEEKKPYIIDDDDDTDDEEHFNVVYDAIRKYNGPMPEELKAPKPGKFYTIFPASDVEEVEMCVHVDRAANEISTNEVNRTTKIVTYYQGHDEYNSRGVWYFEGTPEADGFLPNTGLKLKNLHTLTSLNELGAQGALLTEGGALDVTLEKQGATMVAIRANGNNMARGDVAAKSIIDASTTRTFATDKATITFDWAELNTHVNGNTGEISKDDINTGVVKTDKGSVAFSTSHSIMARRSEEEQIEYNTICTFANANTSPTIEHTFTLSGLGDSFTFNHIALDIHAFNAARKYQANGDNVLRQWNVKAQVSDGNGEFTDFFTLADIDIAAGVGTAGDVHQKWGLAGNEFTTTTGTLVVKLTITKGSENQGCFFGLSEVALSNVGDLWYIEEIKEPEYIYHKTSTNTNGHSTLMLGFNSVIPEGVEAFYSTAHDGKILDEYYLSMKSYGEPADAERILPAVTPVILRNTDKDIVSKNFKFYYTAKQAEPVEDDFTHGSLYFKPIKCNSFDGAFGSDVNIYMLHKDNADVRMYWVWENYDENGNQVGENMDVDGGEGYVLCHANKSFIVLPYNEVGGVSMFSFRFTGSGGTSIEGVELEPEAEYVEAIYDLQGRKLSEITQPGIYIINGKKVMVR